MKRIYLTLLTAAAITLSGTAIAEEFSPAIVFDMGGKFDKSFNEAAYNGAEKFKADSGIEYRDFEVTNPSMREQAMRNMARRGATVIIAMGFAQAAAVEKVGQFETMRRATRIVQMPTGRGWMGPIPNWKLAIRGKSAKPAPAGAGTPERVPAYRLSPQKQHNYNFQSYQHV